jgi:hypothetical protein
VTDHVAAKERAVAQKEEIENEVAKRTSQLEAALEAKT